MILPSLKPQNSSPCLTRYVQTPQNGTWASVWISDFSSHHCPSLPSPSPMYLQTLHALSCSQCTTFAQRAFMPLSAQHMAIYSRRLQVSPTTAPTPLYLPSVKLVIFLCSIFLALCLYLFRAQCPGIRVVQLAEVKELRFYSVHSGCHVTRATSLTLLSLSLFSVWLLWLFKKW